MSPFRRETTATHPDTSRANDCLPRLALWGAARLTFTLAMVPGRSPVAALPSRLVTTKHAARLLPGGRRQQLQELSRIAERVSHLATGISDNPHEGQELARKARVLLAGASLNLPATEHLATRT